MMETGEKRWLDYVAIAAIAAVCYAGTLSGGFVFDDLEVIVGNPLVTGADAGVPGIFTSHYWQHVTPSGNLYRPLTILSYRLNAAIFGPAPASFHAVNVILHILCACLLVPFARRLSFGRGGALAAAAIFAAHPIHTEAVAGVVGRADLMAAAGVLGALTLHLSARMTLPRILAACLLLAGGLLSKESAVVMPAIALAADACRLRRKSTTIRDSAPPLLAYCVTVGVWLAVRAAVLPGAQAGTLSDSVFAGAPWSHQALTALWVFSRYLQLLIAPVTLSADYSFAQTPLVTTALDLRVLLAAVLLAALTLLGLAGIAGRQASRQRRPASLARRQTAFCALAFLASIAPVSNLIIPIGTIMAERLLYLPSAFFCLAFPAVWSMAARVRPAALGAILAAILVLLLGARTVVRNRDWKDQLTLFTATVKTSPKSARAHYNLGIALAEIGREDAALSEYRIAMGINPEDPKPLRNAALLLAAQDRTAEALALFEKAARIDPALPGLLSDLGVIYSRLGRLVEAEASLREALMRNPDDGEAAYNLGSLLLDRGLHEEAIPWLARATARSPEDADAWLHLALALAGAHRPSEAAVAASRARELGLALPPELEELLP